MTIQDTTRPLANPIIVLREDFDDWCVLYNPDSAEAFGVNPVGAALWRAIDGRRSVAELLEGVRREFDDVPDTAIEDLRLFLEQLTDKGMVSLVEPHP